MRHDWLQTSLAVGILFSFLGCASISGTIPVPKDASKTEMFRIGAAKTDITPMAGYPMGGYATAGRLSRGVWTRLYARAVCFEDQDGTALALVSADLWAIPAGLTDKVTELVATQYGAPELSREQIVLAAIHTHNSPGNYSSSPLYNTFGSDKPGFDPDLFSFLAHRIAAAIGQAWKNRLEASLFRSEAPLGKIGRNRSLEAFRKNVDDAGDHAQQLIDSNAGLEVVETAFPAGGPDAYLALDPTLTVLRAVRKDTPPDEPPLAVLAFYAVHPTALGPATEVYSSDLFGVASTTLEQQYKKDLPSDLTVRQDKPAVVALFNGAEGDVSSNWKRRDRPTVLELGGILAEAIRTRVADTGQEVSGKIDFAYDWAPVAEPDIEPMAGAGMFAGSEADWAFMRDAGWREGLRDPCNPKTGQAPKKDPLSPDLIDTWNLNLDLSPIMEHILKLPRTVPLGVYRIGGVVFGTLPGEFTTMAGAQIADAIGKVLYPDSPPPPARPRVLLIGLANEYLSYFTTPLEYDLQHYEGAATLWGLGSTGHIKDALVSLSKKLSPKPTQTEPVEFSYNAGTTKRFGVTSFGLITRMERLRDTYTSVANVLMEEPAGIPVPFNPFVAFIDANPDWPDEPIDVQAKVFPAASIQVKNDSAWEPYLVDGVPENDEGLHFLTTEIAANLGKTRWNMIWMAPAGTNEDARLRFVIARPKGEPVCSTEFTLAQARAQKGFVQLLRGEDGCN